MRNSGPTHISGTLRGLSRDVRDRRKLRIPTIFEIPSWDHACAWNGSAGSEQFCKVRNGARDLFF